MNSSPSADRAYQRYMADKQKEIEERITQETKKILLATLDEKNRARVINWWCLFGVIVIILAVIFGFIATGRAETIDMDAIAQIESSGNPKAYNYKSGAAGMYQITPCVVKDYNACHPYAKIAFNDVYKPSTARTVAKWYMGQIERYLRHFGLPVTKTNIIWAYSAGIGRVVKGVMPEETKQYLKKYARLTGGK